MAPAKHHRKRTRKDVETSTGARNAWRSGRRLCNSPFSIRAPKKCRHPQHMQGTTHPRQLGNGVTRAKYLESASHGTKSSVAASTGAIAGTIAGRLATQKGVPQATSDIAPGVAAFIRLPLCACPLPGPCAPIVAMPLATPPLSGPPAGGCAPGRFPSQSAGRWPEHSSCRPPSAAWVSSWGHHWFITPSVTT